MAATPSYGDPGQAPLAGPRILVIRLSWNQRYNVGSPESIPAVPGHPAGRCALGRPARSVPHEMDARERADVTHAPLGEPVGGLRRGDPLGPRGPQPGQGGVVDP